MSPSRRTYIARVVLAYAVLALAWIFLSDQLLTVFVDTASLVWLSTAKGVFFVLASGACFAVALHAVPNTNTNTTPPTHDQTLFDILTYRPTSRWLMYLFAVTVTATMLLVRMLMQVPQDRPFLFIFMLPIILAALFGGFGPGLTATVAAAALSLYIFIPPHLSFTIANNHDLFLWSLLIINGLVVSLLSGGIHRLRRRETDRLRQVENVNQALKHSEERFRLLFNDAPVAMGLVHHDGHIVAQNRRFERLVGYTLTEMPTLADWWPLAYPDPEYRVQALQQWETALVESQGVSDTFDAGYYRITSKDSSERFVHIFSIRMPDGLLTAFIDETAQHQAEERLRLWAASFEQAQLGLVISDAHANTILTVNPAFARQRGYQPEEMEGMLLAHLFPSHCRADLENLIVDLETARHGLFETEHIDKEGRCFPVLLDITVLVDQNGQPMNRIAYVIDISERKRVEQALTDALELQKQGRIAALNQMQDANQARLHTEQVLTALRESEERLALFIEHAPAALAMFDREMRYLAVSRRWYEDYNLGHQTLLGSCHYDIFPEISKEWKVVHQRGMAGEVIRANEDRFVRADGSVQWLRWEMRPWHNATGDIGGIVIFSEDITTIKQAEDAVRQLNAELEQRVVERTAELTAANRELDSFAYAVSHDLRAPLRAMNGFSQALIEDYGEHLQVEARMYLDQIILGSRKMGELIDGLLTLSRSTRGQVQRSRIDLSVMAQRILASMAKEEPGRRVRCEVEPNITIRGDESMLEAVMYNLLANAWKYTGHRDEAVIRVYMAAAATGQSVCIADNGAGFDPAHADKLFQPFQRLHRQEEFPGIGIGLATVQRIIHRHGGTITAQGIKDKGATFCFTLPK
jgi:PAS domain S-box-containing protein